MQLGGFSFSSSGLPAKMKLFEHLFRLTSVSHPILKLLSLSDNPFTMKPLVQVTSIKLSAGKLLSSLWGKNSDDEFIRESKYHVVALAV